jgi:hypothetical protein
MGENSLVRFFRLMDEAERTGELPTSQEDVGCLANVPGVGSISEVAARSTHPELVQRLYRLHERANRTARVMGY